MPGGSTMILKSPSLFVVADFSRPVCWLVAVMVAPATAAPLGSSTRPSIFPLLACDCAKTPIEIEIEQAKIRRNLRRGNKFRFMDSPGFPCRSFDRQAPDIVIDYEIR